MSESPSPKSQKQLQENIEKHMNMLTQNSDRVKKYFHHQDIKYVA